MNSSRLRNHAFTVYEVLVVVALLAIIAALAIAASTQGRQQARSATCVGNLRSIGTAAMQYANDHQGRFFYHWTGQHIADRNEAEHAFGWWYDSKRAGAYLQDVARRPLRWPDGDIVKGTHELVGHPLYCPTYDLSEDQPYRSYAMNHWASGIQANSRPPTHFEAWAGRPTGAYFNQQSNDLDRLVLFAEAIVAQRYDDSLGIDRETFFGLGASPSQYWAGYRDPATKVEIRTLPTGRQAGPSVSEHNGRIVDYSRHQGKTNIAHADGAVKPYEQSDVFNSDTGEPTYKVLWSPIDHEVDSWHSNYSSRLRGARP